ncbi:efflux transporter outer membrane subunit [Oceanobacter mangrovi]|uniref:efflux transporter outer membrane subunit n=1 Tax=Oceanobacter mangrovi TaxID=2862510 RepID=UPI001C8E8DC3
MLLLAGLAGCSSVEPLPQQPAEQLQLALADSQDSALAATPDWWLDFADPQLSQLIEQGLQHNYSLQAALANWRASQAQLAATTADQALQADASVQAGHEWQQDGNAAGWSLGVAADYEVDFWGRLDGLSRAAELQSQAQWQASRTVANSVAAEISLAWFGMAYQSRRLQLLQQQGDRINDSLKLTEARFQRGLVVVSDVWQQQQLLESLHASQLAASAELTLYRQQLALWLGEGAGLGNQPPAAAPLADALPALPAFDGQLSLQQLQQRPDVQQAWFELQASDAQLAAAVANQYPRLTLSAGLQGSGGSIASALDNWAFNLVAGLVAPLLDGGARQAQIQQQQAERQAALADYRQTLLAAAQEVQGLLVSGNHQQQQQLSIERQLDLARRSYDYQAARYRRGVGDFLATLSAQQDVLDLEQQRLQSQWQQLNNRINLYRALSQGLYAPESSGSFSS